MIIRPPTVAAVCSGCSLRVTVTAFVVGNAKIVVAPVRASDGIDGRVQCVRVISGNGPRQVNTRYIRQWYAAAMPFVQRAVGPVRLSRAKLHDERGAPTVRDGELEAVTNCALSNALRQMASVATLADEVFRELRGQLADVAARSAGLKLRVQAVGRLVDASDPRAVTVRNSSFFFLFFFCRYHPGFDSPVSVPSYSPNPFRSKAYRRPVNSERVRWFYFCCTRLLPVIFDARSNRRDIFGTRNKSPIISILLQSTGIHPCSKGYCLVHKPFQTSLFPRMTNAIHCPRLSFSTKRLDHRYTAM